MPIDALKKRFFRLSISIVFVACSALLVDGQSLFTSCNSPALKYDFKQPIYLSNSESQWSSAQNSSFNACKLSVSVDTAIAFILRFEVNNEECKTGTLNVVTGDTGSVVSNITNLCELSNQNYLLVNATRSFSINIIDASSSVNQSSPYRFKGIKSLTITSFNYTRQSN